MKKLFLSSLVLLVFSLSLLTFQLSCKKEAIAQNSNYVLPPATSSSLGGIIVGSGLSITSSGVLSVSSSSATSSELIIFLRRNSSTQQYEIWTSDASGNNQKLIPITLPAGFNFSFGLEGGQLKLSPDRSTIYFTASNTTGNNSYSSTNLFSCSITGSNVKKIIDGCYFNYDVR